MKIRLGFALAAGALGAAAQWSEWRGGMAAGVGDGLNLPTEWSETRNIAWKTEIPGRGLSSPALAGGLIFLTTSFEGDVIEGRKPPIHYLNGQLFLNPDSTSGNRRQTLKVLAVDAASGKIVWERTSYEGPVYDDRIRKNTYASPTAAADGKRVYAWFESQGLYAYERDGRPAWKASFGDMGSHGTGPGTSPILYGDLLLLQCDIEGDSFLAGISTRDGKVVWKSKRKERLGWSTPLLMRDGGRTRLVLAATSSTVVYDPSNGEELWRGPGLESNAVPTPVAGQGMVFVMSGHPSKRVLAFKPGGAEAPAWKYEKGVGYVPSPVLYGDHLYVISDTGLLTCLDARTGALVYEGKRPPKPARVTASLVAFDGKLLVTSEDGDTFVIRAGPEHEVLRTNSVGEPVWASPALAPGVIYLRGARHLYSIRAPAAGE